VLRPIGTTFQDRLIADGKWTQGEQVLIKRQLDGREDHREHWSKSAGNSYATSEFALRDKLAAARDEERVGAGDSTGCCESACTSWDVEIDYKVNVGD
jgi:hypothetical protein